MSVIERLLIAIQSSFGGVIVLLLALFTALLCIYAVLFFKQRRRLSKVGQQRSYIEEGLALASEWSVSGEMKRDFFGWQCVGRREGSSATLQLLDRELLDTFTEERLQAFAEGTRSHKLPVIAPAQWYFSPSRLQTLLLQRDTLEGQGGNWICLRELMRDGHLSVADMEFILLQLAQGLAALHDLKSVSGEPLYHGFVLPRSVWVTLNERGSVGQVRLVDGGLAFGLGDARMAERLGRLNAGKLPLERFWNQTLQQQVSHLAPEQKRTALPEGGEMGQEVDFYAFAALAVSLFTKTKFVSEEQVSWDKVPDRWHPFLKRSLQTDAKRRPTDFLELEDWLKDPELLLAWSETSHEEQAFIPSSATDSLESLLGRFIEERHQPAKVQLQEVQALLDKGRSALRASRWAIASKHLEQAHQLEPDNAEILTQLAIACYEQGDRQKAESLYTQARGQDPAAARAYREHLAFRVV